MGRFNSLLPSLSSPLLFFIKMNRRKKFPFQCLINQQRKQQEKQEKINGISDLKIPRTGV